jgi:hypothetical protein
VGATEEEGVEDIKHIILLQEKCAFEDVCIQQICKFSQEYLLARKAVQIL